MAADIIEFILANEDKVHPDYYAAALYMAGRIDVIEYFRRIQEQILREQYTAPRVKGEA